MAKAEKTIVLECKKECKKDWILDGVVHFAKGASYKGEWKEDFLRPGMHTFTVSGKLGLPAGNFHSGSDYFDIPFGDGGPR